MTLLLHINAAALTSRLVKKFRTASLNKRHRLGDFHSTRLRLLASFVLAGAAAAASAQAKPFKSGYWVSSGREIVLQIAPCGDDLCGFIAGIALSHPGDAMPTDWRGQPQCGFLMLRVAPAPPADDGTERWKGALQDPRNGNVYRTMVKFDAAGNLGLHGYIGLPILGETQVWPKFNGQILPGCHVPSLDGKAAAGT